MKMTCRNHSFVNGYYGYDDLVYLIINGKDFISGDYLISEIYDKYKDYQDDLLYLAYSDNSKWL